jgi:phosphoribosylanthranilate isomerase
MAHLRVKICGITHEADASQAALLGADAIGLNFYAQTPRSVDAAAAGRILRELPPFVNAVGVFVNLPLPEVLQTTRRFDRLDTVQWHGDKHAAEDVPPLPLIAAFAVQDRHSLGEISSYLDACRARGQLPAAVLVDARVGGLYGGTGRTAPWHLLADFRPGVPLILAGGLTPDNVAEAVRLVRPYAVDVASGVEDSPGRKDPEKMLRFIHNAREAAAKLKDEG